MKAILIDVYNENVRQVEVDDNDQLNSMYKHINCETVDRVQINDHDDIWVDDEGLLNLTKDSKFFTYEGRLLAGNGLVMGCDRMGESIEPCITVEEVLSHVEFHDYVQAYIISRQQG
jgi:hypothetical protein